ncbi:hypothetical protein [Ornithobacterium rhinotracheale]
MRNKILFFSFLLLIGTTCKAQFYWLSTNSFKINALGGYGQFVGGNAFSKTYEGLGSWGVEAEMEMPFWEKLSIGVLYHKSYTSPKTGKFFGNFSSARLHSVGVFASYSFRLKKRFSFTPKIGISDFLLKNKFNDYSQNFNGTEYWLAPEIEYKITDEFGVFGRTTFSHIHTQVKTDEEILNDYKNPKKYSVQLGLRFFLN